jgi:hypothetical protein
MKHTLNTVFLLATLALAACSNDELVNESTQNPNEIRFNVVSDPSSRAMTSYYYTGLHKPDAFYVRANIGGETSGAKYGNPYISLELQQKQAGSDYYTSANGTHLWPADGIKLDFYAHYNALDKNGAEIAPTMQKSTDGKQYYSLNNISLPSEEHSQRDLVYAATLDQSRSTSNNGSVNINFKHALAQLAFKVQCEDPNLVVLINGVTIYNVYREGSMAFGETSTNGAQAADNTDARSCCTWTVADYKTDKRNVEKYTVDMNRGVADANKFACSYVYYDNGVETPVVQDITPTVDSEGNTTGGMMVVPQAYESWTPSTDGTWTTIEQETTTAAGVHQAYIGLSCRIYHLKQNDNKAVNSADFFEFDGAKLKNTAAVAALSPELKYGGTDASGNDNGEFKELVVPMPVMNIGTDVDNWQAGRKYVYTFKIGTGSNGGYDPGSGDPVLRAITFTGGIVDWIIGDTIAIKE